MGGVILTAIGKTPEEVTEIADAYEDKAYDLGLTDVRHRSEPIQKDQLKDLPEWLPVIDGLDWVVFLWIHS